MPVPLSQSHRHEQDYNHGDESLPSKVQLFICRFYEVVLVWWWVRPWKILIRQCGLSLYMNIKFTISKLIVYLLANMFKYSMRRLNHCNPSSWLLKKIMNDSATRCRPQVAVALVMWISLLYRHWRMLIVSQLDQSYLMLWVMSQEHIRSTNPVKEFTRLQVLYNMKEYVLLCWLLLIYKSICVEWW